MRSAPAGENVFVTTTSLANPRRTRLAGARQDKACQVSGPQCRGTATDVLHTPDGDRASCTTCAGH